MENFTFPPQQTSSTALIAITPTVFFVKVGEALKQRVEISLEIGSSIGFAELITRSPAGEILFPLGLLTPDQTMYTVWVPDLPLPVDMVWELRVDGHPVDCREIRWQPTRHWTIHLAPTSHHDLGYTDLPSNLLREHDRFIDEVLDFCDETDNFPEESRFHYTVEQAWSILHWVSHRSPAQIERLAQRIRQGRIEVTALFGNETTELCGSEELVRLLYPAYRLGRRFGIDICTAELNDIPGLAWGLASVLAGAGIRYLTPGIPDYFQWGKKVRFLWDEAEVLQRGVPGAFWWEGPDGGRVLFWYWAWSGGVGNVWTYEQAEDYIPGRLAWLEESGYPYQEILARVQGGHRDNSPPDLRFSLIAREWNSHWAYPRMSIGTITPFLKQLEKDAGPTLKRLRGDIPGTDYPLGAASTARETGINRGTHDLLTSAECLATWASVSAGMEYPAESLREAYDQMLLYDEHTWGMAHPVGIAQEACWSQKAQNAYRAAALAQDIFSKSANYLADHVCLDQEGYHLVVFNPLAQRRTDLAIIPSQEASPCSKPMHWVTVQEGEPQQWSCGNAIGRGLIALPDNLMDSSFELVDTSSGQSVPYQVVTLTDPLTPRLGAAHRVGLGNSEPVSVNGLNYEAAQVKDLVFVVEDIPALGFKAYRIVPSSTMSKNEATNFKERATAGDDWLENRFYRLQIDPASGAVMSIYDKELGVELVDGEAPHGFNQLVIREPRTGITETSQQITLERGKRGPLVSSLVVRGAGHGCLRLVQEITLYAGLKRIDFANRFLKDAAPLIEHHFAFPFGLTQPDWLYEAPGALVRPVYDQLPGTNTNAYAVQRWIRLTGQQAQHRVAVTWSSLDAPNVSFGKLWSSPVSQAHHGVTPPDYGQEFLRSPDGFGKAHLYSWAALSNFRTNFQPAQPADLIFRYSLTSSEAEADCQASGDFGWSTANPLAGVCIRGPQAGNLSQAIGFCNIDPPNVRLQALKVAEDGHGIILRLVETSGKESEARIELLYLVIEQVFLTNLVEQNLGVIACSPHQIKVTLPARGTVTLRCLSSQYHWPEAQGAWYD